MIELRLHRAIYRGDAVDAALQAFVGHGTFERAEEPDHWVVRVAGSEGSGPDRERRLAGELGNWALGLTLRRPRKVPSR